MTDHIQLWYHRVGFVKHGEVIGVAYPKKPRKLCTELYKQEKITVYGSIILFWRTDRELVNCFRCLARLKEMENYD